MMEFNVPFVGTGVSVKEALLEAIDAGRSGVLLKTGRGKLRLVHFDRIADASVKGVKLLQEVDGEEVVKFGRVLATERLEFVQSVGGKFGLVGEEEGRALLFSVSEQFGSSYASPPWGVRCDRPGKPPNRSAQKWYHYYPPNQRNPQKPKDCILCGGKLP